jgi:hypothetical protein
MYNYQDADGRFIPTVYFIALVFTCAILFINVIVAILFDNYEDGDEEGKNEDLKELQDKADELGIPQEISSIIINNDIILGNCHLIFLSNLPV